MRPRGGFRADTATPSCRGVGQSGAEEGSRGGGICGFRFKDELTGGPLGKGVPVRGTQLRKAQRPQADHCILGTVVTFGKVPER